jgi:dCTP deaminase
MIEPSQWLLAHAATLGLTPDAIGPASADLRGSGHLKEWQKGFGGVFTSREIVLEEGDVFWFTTGRFYLASTLETIHVPPTHAASIAMRSSLARRGLGHKMAGYVDPGFTGQITLELETSIPVQVTIGERIVQIVYQRLTEATVQPYQGKYQGQTGPTEAYRGEGI